MFLRSCMPLHHLRQLMRSWWYMHRVKCLNCVFTIVPTCSNSYYTEAAEDQLEDMLPGKKLVKEVQQVFNQKYGKLPTHNVHVYVCHCC